MKYVVVMCTASGREEALYISKELIRNKLVASVNIVNSVTSMYFDKQGELIEKDECIMYLKTKEELYEAVHTTIHNFQTYKVHEILALPINGLNKEYSKWLSDHII